MTKVFASLFNEEKASEVAFFFVMKAKENRYRLTSSRLMNLLYLAEKASYSQYGNPMTGDQLFSMEHGPVLGSIFDFLESPDPSSCGNGNLANVLAVHQNSDPNHRYVEATAGASFQSSDDLMSLSIADVEILEGVWEKNGKKSTQDLERFVKDSDNNPEWRWRGRSGEVKNSIELEDLLASLKFSEEEQASTVNYLHDCDAINKIFGQ